MNNLAHRTEALAATTLIEGESRELFESLVSALISKHKPESELEMMLVESLALRTWTRLRLLTLEDGATGRDVVFLRRVAKQLDRGVTRTLKTIYRERSAKK